MAEPVPSSLPMLAAGVTATSDNTHDGPIKRRNNPRRFPHAQGSTEVSAESRGSYRPYRGRRNDRPRQNRSTEDSSQQNQHNGPGPVGDVTRNNLNDSHGNQRTLPENPVPACGARPRNESQRRGSGRGFRGNRGIPRTPREPELNPDSSTSHNDGQATQNRQNYRVRGSRNWPRIPRDSAGVRNDRKDAQPERDDAKLPRQLSHDTHPDPTTREPRIFNANRGRPQRYSTGRVRNRRPGNGRVEPLNDHEAPQNAQAQVDQPVIHEQSAIKSASPVGGVLRTELPEKQLSPEELAQLRVREIQQFKTRFPKSIPQDDDSFLFTFSPTDPDWVFDVRSIQLKVHFSAEYPSVPLSIVVVNTDDVLPSLLVEDVDNAIIGWIKFFHKPGQLSFRPFLRWIDRNLQEIFVESLRKIKKLQERPSVVLVDQENLNPCDAASSPENESVSESLNLDTQPVTSWPMKALPKKQKRLEELDDLFDDSVRPKPEVQKVPSHGPLATSQLSKIFNNYDPHTPPRRGIEVKFRHVDFSESVSFVVCDRLLVSVQCKKCKKIADFQLLPGRRSVSHCAKCQTKLEACFGPSILLQFNPLLGYLELKECTIRDVALSRCHFYADCLNCTKLSPLENIHLGHRGSSHCQNCNVKMTFVMDSFKYMDLCAIEANIKASNLKKANKDSAIQAGKPLPSNGACKHYKKSFRWFRFPCCGKAYPCDTCHDTAEDHEAEFASRMICGFCAKEQPFSNDKPCSQCSNLITGRRTAHWEGGKGCRNQLKMDTNDTRKYAGMNKTVSRKSTAKSK